MGIPVTANPIKITHSFRLANINAKPKNNIKRIIETTAHLKNVNCKKSIASYGIVCLWIFF